MLPSARFAPNMDSAISPSQPSSDPADSTADASSAATGCCCRFATFVLAHCRSSSCWCGAATASTRSPIATANRKIQATAYRRTSVCGGSIAMRGRRIRTTVVPIMESPATHRRAPPSIAVRVLRPGGQLMRKQVAVTTGVTLATLACMLSGAAVATAAPGSGAVSRGPAARLTSGAARHWPARTVLAEPLSLGITNQAVDQAAGADYVLATAGQSFRLRRMPLSGAFVKVGPTFPVNGIGLGAGSVWVFGARPAGHGSQRLVLYQVNRSSLAVTRSWRLSGAQRRSGFVAVAPGGGGTEWVGFLRTVLRINASSGAIVAR